jgi:hypothetical protein
MKVRFYDINYDTDGFNVELPTELELDVDADLDLDQFGADCISDETGYCVNSFNYEIVS